MLKPLQRQDGGLQQRNVFRWVINKPAPHS
jgi:hypothetical protein